VSSGCTLWHRSPMKSSKSSTSRDRNTTRATLGEGLLDRLTHRVHIVEANGPSYRLRQSKRRLQKQDPKNDEDDSPDSETTGSGDA